MLYKVRKTFPFSPGYKGKGKSEKTPLTSWGSCKGIRAECQCSEIFLPSAREKKIKNN